MKKLYSSFLRVLILSLPLLLQWVYSTAQTVTKTTPSPITGAVCPVSITEYSVSIPTGFQNCSRLWSVTNGQIEGSATGTTVKVKWSDSPGTKGRVTCTFSNCGNSNDNTAPFLEELTLSVKNQTWGSYATSANIDYCTKARVYLTVPRMFVLGTGGIGQPPQVEVAYGWTLPAGWKEVGTGRTGFFGTPTNFVTIEPIECSKPGSVKVYGTLVGAGPFCNSSAPSATATISLNGANPVLTVGPQAGYTGGSVCNQTPVTFYATTSVALGCITSYNWVYPQSWQFMSKSGNSITLRPSGAPADSNPVKVTVNFSCGSSIASGNYIPPYAQTSITGSDLICSSGSFSVQNSSGVTVTWSSGNTNVATVNSSGVVTRTGSANGQVTITAAFPCSAPPNTKTIWVGGPDVGASYISGATTTSCNMPYTYQFWGGAAGASSMTWEASAHFTLGINGLNATLTPTQYGEGFLSMEASNTCGSTYTCLTVCATGCETGLLLFPNHPCATFENCGFNLMSAYPNPTEESLTIKLSDDADFKAGEEYSINIIDETGNKAFSRIVTSKEFIIRKGEIKPGRYIIQCTGNGKTILNQRLIVK